MTWRLAAYGGSFNPFGLHHLDIIHYLLDEGGFNEVTVVTSAAHPLKTDLPPYIHRLNMTRLGVAEARESLPKRPHHRHVAAEDLEGDMLQTHPAPIYTLDLLRELRIRHPYTQAGRDLEIRFAIGPDIREELHRWKAVDEIEREFGFHDIPDISARSLRATDVRQMIAEGVEDWRRHVTPGVAKYIELHNLYGVKNRESNRAS